MPRRSLSPMTAFTLACGLSLTLAACSHQQRVGAEKAVASALVSDEDEVKLGLQVKQELEAKGVKYVNDPTVTGFVQSIADRILPHANKDRPNVRWQIFVIDDPKTVNAFATPGGFLYVYTGLLKTAATEGEIAGVLAHEAGHVVGRHSARQMVNAYGLQAVLGMALGENPNLVTQVASTVAAQGVLLAHGRSEETEADELGARYASQGGYDPQGLIRFFEKLQSQEGKTPRVLTWLSTHPQTGDRIRHLQDFIAKNGLRGSDPGSARLAPVQKRIAGS